MEELAVDGGPTRRPRGWSERWDAAQWRATYAPKAARVWLAGALLILLGALRTIPVESVLYTTIVVVASLAVFAAVASRLTRTWRFDIDGVRLRIVARGVDRDIPLREVSGLTLVVARQPDRSPRTITHYAVQINRHGGSAIDVPLFVLTDAEARFVAMRLTAALESGGRSHAVDYRGARLRIADHDENLAETVAAEEEAATAEAGEDGSRRSTRS